MTSAADVATVKGRISIVDVIGARVVLKPAGREHVGLCPFHSERTPSFTVNPDKAVFHCHGCGAGGDVLTFLEKADGLEFPAALAQLAQATGVTLDDSPPLNRKARARLAAAAAFGLAPAAPAPLPPRQPEPLEPCRADLGPLLAGWQRALPGSPGADYLAGRGIPLELAQAHGIGFATGEQWADAWTPPDSTRRVGPGRVTIPHTRADGVAVNCYGRAVEDGGPRHLHLRGRRGLFNAGALVDSAAPVYVTEAPLDALALMAAGYPAAVALFGTHGMPWDELPAGVRLVVALDADEPGRKAADELLAEARRRGLTCEKLPPDAYGPGCKDASEARTAGTLAPPPSAPILGASGTQRPQPPTEPISGRVGRYSASESVPEPEPLDPRPALTEDAHLWRPLLARTAATEPGLLGAMLGARCAGALLTETPHGLRLAPRPGTEDDYATVRPYLTEHRDAVSALLRSPS